MRDDDDDDGDINVNEVQMTYVMTKFIMYH